MKAANLAVGKPYPGSLPEHDASVVEFSKEGPELRLFFSRIPEDVVDHVANDDCYLGLLRSGDLGVVPWKIDDVMSGDAQFHVFLYPPETRPTPEILAKDSCYEVRIMLVDRATGILRVLRRVRLSTRLSAMLNEVIAEQLGRRIDYEAYDAQVSIYQNQYENIADAIAAAPIFEKASPCVHAS